MNKEKLKSYWEKVKTTCGKVPKKIWILIAVIVVVAAAAAIYLYNNRPYAVLVDGATDAEMATVTAWLGEQGVTDWKMESPGTILVPEAQATSLKARLLQEQYSSANASPSLYFERVGALSTMFDRKKADLEDMETSLEQTIRAFPGVHDVTVKINPGEDQSYVLYANHVVDASASVMLFMEQGKLLTAEQGNAIRNYVSHAIPNLKIDNVDVRDSIGNTYGDFSGASGNANSDSALKLQLEQEYNNRVRTAIVEALSAGYGADNVSVVVHTTIELGNKTVNTHEVELPSFAEDGSTNGRGIIGQEFYAYTFNTPDEGATGGTVGTATNSDLPTYVEPGEAQAELESILQEEANRVYDNETTDTEMIVYCGTVKDMSVAVWINGRAIQDMASFDEENERRWIAAAANIEPMVTEEMTGEEYLNWKIALKTDPFVEPPVEPEPPAPKTLLGLEYWVWIAAGVGLLVFVIILVVVLLVSRRKKRAKRAAEEKAMEELLAAAESGEAAVVLNEEGEPVMVEVGPDGQPVETPVQLDENGDPVGGANVMDLHTERSMQLRQNIRDFVDENMEVAALLLKSWIKEGEEDE